MSFRITLWKTVTTGILTSIFVGILTAFASMYNDLYTLKAKESGRDERVEEIYKSVKKIEWFLIEGNSVKIDKRGK